MEPRYSLLSWHWDRWNCVQHLLVTFCGKTSCQTLRVNHPKLQFTLRLDNFRLSFMMWNGRNFAGFEVSHPPPPPQWIKKIGKNSLVGAEGLKMCACLSLLQSEITFGSFGGSPQNLCSWFGLSSPRGRPNPKKWAFCEIYLLPGFWGKGVILCLYGNGTTKQKNIVGIILNLGKAQKQGWRGGLARQQQCVKFYKI